MTMQNLLQQCRKKSHSKVLRFWVVLAAAALLLVLACRGYDWDALGRYKGDNISSLHYVRGRVVEVLRDDTKPDQLDPARSMGTQELRILLLEGANKGTEVTIANYLTRTQNVRLRQGETAIICEDLPDSADAYYTVYNYDRAPVLVLILAVFAAAVVAIGGWKGVRTLLGLGFTGAMIAWLILPGIYHGLPSLLLTVAALAVCTLVSLLLLNPPSPKTWAAMLSTLAGVALAGGVFQLFSTLLHLSGMNDTNGEGLVLVAGQTGLELHWLLLVAVLISSLGAVMDVALSLASSLHELREADGKMSGLQLFAAGMTPKAMPGTGWTAMPTAQRQFPRTFTRNPMAANGSAMTKTARWSRDGTPTRTAPTTLTPSPAQWQRAMLRLTACPAALTKPPALV